MVKQQELNKFLNDISYGMEFQILDESKDKSELDKIAEAHKIQMPCKDLAILKGKFAFTNERNANGCFIERAEFEKALGTIGGKLLDLNHNRSVVRGHWLEGFMDGDTVYAYAVIYKEAFKKDFQKIKDLFANNALKLSMEAWGTRVFTNASKTEYDLEDIEIAGGAVLVDRVQPAFKNAEVIELAKELGIEEQVLEFCHVKEKEEKVLEKSQFTAWDFGTIMRLIYECTCPDCQAVNQDMKYTDWEVDVIDFENGLAKISCPMCDGEYVMSFTPAIVGKLSEDPNETEDSKKDSKRKILKIEKNSTAKVEVVKDKSVEKSSEEQNIMDMEKAMKELQDKFTTLEAAHALLVKENETLKNDLAASNKALEDAKVQFEADKTKAVEDAIAAEKAAVETAKKLEARKTELGEFAKDMKDEEILDDAKFELAKAKKTIAEKEAELAALKGGKKPEVAKKELVVGSKKKEVSSELKDAQKRVTEKAFGHTSEKEA